jgi:hypothetical protein
MHIGRQGKVGAPSQPRKERWGLTLISAPLRAVFPRSRNPAYYNAGQKARSELGSSRGWGRTDPRDGWLGHEAVPGQGHESVCIDLTFLGHVRM